MDEPATAQLLPFTAHRLELPDGTTTADQGEDVALAPSTLAVLRHFHGDLTGRRVLDLGCLEGGYAFAFAAAGASEVVGVEARERNLERARWAQRLLGADRVRFVRDDVKNVTAATYGRFDCVFASGILYHLDDPWSFLTNVAAMTSDVLVVDTSVALPAHWAHGCSPELTEREFGGAAYTGRVAAEYDAGTPQEDVETYLWGAYSNPTSFWLTADSLVEMLWAAGFALVERVYQPAGYRCVDGCPMGCRVLLTASKARP